jgi:quinol monooxygenase YgiN
LGISTSNKSKEKNVTTDFSAEKPIITIINVFTVRPENQQHLIDALVKGTPMMLQQPGAISTTLHRSLDGTKVTNYAQWENRETYEAMLQDPEATKHRARCRQFAEKVEPALYEVVFRAGEKQ